MQVRTVLIGVPADPLISVTQLQGRSTEGKTTEPAMIGIDEVAQLAPHQGASTLRVLTDHHFIPDSHQINTVYLHLYEPLYSAY